MKKILYTFALISLVLPQLSLADEATIVSSKTNISPGSEGGIAYSKIHSYPMSEEDKKKELAELQPLR